MQEIIRIDLDGTNSYLLKQNDCFILVDTGGHIILDKQFDNRRERLLAALSEAGCTMGHLKLIVLTHGDNDHTASTAYLKEKYQVKAAMHADDVRLVEKPDLSIMMESFRYRSAMNKVIFTVLKKLITKVSQKILSDYESFVPDILLQDGQSLKEYGFDATIIHLPGHTAGSIGILTAGGDLIAGDILVNVKKPEMAPNAIDFKLLKNSLKRLGTLQIHTVYPGHGKPFPFVSAKVG